jgi:hypothetical protein
VTAKSKRWKTQIKYDSKQRYLGTFDTKQEAALVYDREARQCGEEKPLNYESLKAAEQASVHAKAEWTMRPKPRPPSGFYGVSAKGKRWRAEINYSGKKHYLGSFATKEEAALTHDKQARQCGEEKQLNYHSIKAAEEAAAHAHAQAGVTSDGVCAVYSSPSLGHHSTSNRASAAHEHAGSGGERRSATAASIIALAASTPADSRKHI